MIYQKLTTGMGQCLLLIRKHADRDGFELWRRKERCWCYFNNVGAEYFKEFFDMRGELTDISEAEALELNYVNDRKLASVPDASFLFYLVFFNILITLSRMFV